MKMDETDLTIIAELQHDGRITNAELADRVGLSASACLRRVKALEAEGVISRYVALVAPEALDRATTVYVEITLSSQQERHLDAFEAEIARCPEVMSCHLMSGEADYLVRLACAGVNDYERIHRNQLSILPGVARLRSSFAMRQVCDRTAFAITGHEPDTSSGSH
ncbi:MAG: Lrp/AsnC family transcriptional regulator [Actinomycetota bacterium]